MTAFRVGQRVEFNEEGKRVYARIIADGAPSTFVIAKIQNDADRLSSSERGYPVLTEDSRTLYSNYLRLASIIPDPSPMTIWMIWVAEDDDGRVEPWLFDAMDEESTSVNPDGWRALVDNAQNQYRDRVRIIRTEVDYTAVKAAFMPPVVRSTGLVVEP